MEDAKALAALAKYAKGQQMVLRPFMNPGPPHTTGMFPDPQGTDSSGRAFDNFIGEHPTNFDRNTFIHFEDKELAVLEVVGTISGGLDHSRQILRCKAIRTPVSHEGRTPMPIFDDKQQYIVAVAEDAALYDDPFWADNHLCRKVAVLQELHKRTKTGLGTVNPDYYGTWILETDDHTAEAGKRYIGIILMEHLEGRTIEELCTREPAPDGERGNLIAPSNPISITGADGAEHLLDVTSTEVRHHIVKQIMHGVVDMEHVGIQRSALNADDVMVVFRRGGEILDKPQAVLLEFLVCEVWSTLWDGEKLFDNSDDLYQQLPRPLHPFDEFTHNDFEDLDGWYDTNWRAENRVRLDAWMLKQFGLLTESRRYSPWNGIEARTKDKLRRLFRALDLIANQQTRDFAMHALPPIPQPVNRGSLSLRQQPRVNYAMSQGQPIIDNSPAIEPTRSARIEAEEEDTRYLRFFVQERFEDNAKRLLAKMLQSHPRLADATPEYADSAADESLTDEE
ncbi:hypothetical protein GCG54_00012393 [Colletotrichum gloeosporioides]|uniref:Uncharacterized protein n=1 Tax=Colletotrichum gloeosporioides TaxID=474922 RepID=A0A8H4CE69_COLGL|nr:uncharacterized protein GCG54_00012393 [Colletotrichum gloeosporioides]KAF3802147.1 hypothetical protein GCG54_00012393 [Colletotrichum gloeosporioides]